MEAILKLAATLLRILLSSIILCLNVTNLYSKQFVKYATWNGLSFDASLNHRRNQTALDKLNT